MAYVQCPTCGISGPPGWPCQRCQRTTANDQRPKTVQVLRQARSGDYQLRVALIECYIALSDRMHGGRAVSPEEERTVRAVEARVRELESQNTTQESAAT
jgi:hypothetical protein